MTFLVLTEIDFAVVFAFIFPKYLVFNEDAQLARHIPSSGLSSFNTHLVSSTKYLVYGTRYDIFQQFTLLEKFSFLLVIFGIALLYFSVYRSVNLLQREWMQRGSAHDEDDDGDNTITDDIEQHRLDKLR